MLARGKTWKNSGKDELRRGGSWRNRMEGHSQGSKDSPGEKGDRMRSSKAKTG